MTNLQKLARTALCAVFFCSFTNPGFADATKVKSIVSKVESAYGGKALTEAKSIKITDYNKGPWPGESENPGVPEVWRINEELTIDFENKRKMLLSYRVPRTTVDLEKWIVENDKGVIYDILHQKYAAEDWITYQNLGGSVVRSSDTMHAKQLGSNLDNTSYIGEEYYRGKVHQKLAVSFSSGWTFTYFIDQESGLIQKLQREHPKAGILHYIFSNHQHADGVVFASDMNLFVDGALRLTSVERNIVLNPDTKTAFTHHVDYKPWGKTIDSSTMTAKKLADNVYQAGKGRSLSVFIEHPAYYIALGGANQLQFNFDAVKTLSKNNKPLKYYIVSHHHRGSLEGLNNALALGAKLVTAQAHLSTIQDTQAPKITAENFVVIPDRKPFSLGSLQLFDIATAHSQHYLMTYLPSEKMIIADEHYETNLQTDKPRIYKDMVLFSKVLDSLNIPVETLVDFRSWRRFSIEEFKQWTKEFTEKTCPKGYSICANG